MLASFREAGLHTVCESARCPNMGQCWGRGVATFMILGDVCTRACRFCAVKAGRSVGVDEAEPAKIAGAVRAMRLKYAVITSVARDDLPDEGAGHFARTIRAVRGAVPGIRIEVLVPDFSAREDCLRAVADAGPDVFAHNVETVERLTPAVRPQADYRRSLEVFRVYRRFDPGAFLKSSIMVGLGETGEEILTVMQDLRGAGCEILTVGQYLRPTRHKRNVPVDRFVPPEQFEAYREKGLAMGFRHVMSGPLVRSSYIAEEGYKDCLAASGGRGKAMTGAGTS